jgi:hypothetical protein
MTDDDELRALRHALRDADAALQDATRCTTGLRSIHGPIPDSHFANDACALPRRDLIEARAKAAAALDAAERKRDNQSGIPLIAKMQTACGPRF